MSISDEIERRYQACLEMTSNPGPRHSDAAWFVAFAELASLKLFCLRSEAEKKRSIEVAIEAAVEAALPPARPTRRDQVAYAIADCACEHGATMGAGLAIALADAAMDALHRVQVGPPVLVADRVKDLVNEAQNEAASHGSWNVIQDVLARALALLEAKDD